METHKMSKKDSVVSEKVESNEPNKNAEIPSSKEVIQTLRMQLEEHLKQSEYHKTMAVKAQGALEVLLQLNPEEQEKQEEN
tara:strand:- start:672 stop:914 length:243 start_codon:yes stop_codon:yes gene_type:complete